MSRKKAKEDIYIISRLFGHPLMTPKVSARLEEIYIERIDFLENKKTEKV